MKRLFSIKGGNIMCSRFVSGIIVLVVLFLGCACALLPKSARGPLFSAVQVPPGKAVVYFFRSDRFMMSATTIFMSIPLEANNCFAMVTSGYYPYATGPGELRVLAVSFNVNQKEFSINLKPGDEKYVKVDFSTDFVPVLEFQEIPADKATAEIKAYRMIDKCE